MTAAEVVRRLHRHRIWCQGQLVAAARSLAPEGLHQEFENGQGSVWSTLVHLHATDRLWLDAIEGQPRSATTRDPAHDSLATLADAWEATTRRWLDYLDRLDEAELSRRVERVDQAGSRLVLDATDAHLQLCTHAAGTAAQVIQMLRRLGVQPLPDCLFLRQAQAEGRLTLAPVLAGGTP